MANQVNIKIQNDSQVDLSVLSGNSYSDLYLIFGSSSDDTISITFDEVVGRFNTTNKTLTNIASVDSIKVNSSTVSGDFQLNNGDTLKVTITRSDNTKDSKIQFDAQ